MLAWKPQLPLLLGVALLVASLTVTFAPVAKVAAAIRQVSRVAPGQREVALVFNGDAWPGRIRTILQTLRDHRTRLTFFLTGEYLVNFPSQARAIYAAGQQIASHGYEQRDYRDLSNPQIV